MSVLGIWNSSWKNDLAPEGRSYQSSPNSDPHGPAALSSSVERDWKPCHWPTCVYSCHLEAAFGREIILRVQFRSFRKYWEKEKGAWLGLIIPLALFLAIVLSFGPYLQHFGYSSLEQGAPSAADLEAGSSIIILPPLANWLTQFLYGPFVLIGLISAYFGSRASTPLQIAIVSSLCVFVAISIFDLVSEGLRGEISTDSFTRNLVANFMGALFLALLTSFSLVFYEWASNESHGIVLKYLTALIMPATAFVISLIAYYILYFFFQPLGLRISFDSSPPVSGFYAAEIGNGELKSDKRFAFLPKSVRNGFAKIEGADGTTEIEWQSLSQEQPFSLEMYATSDCWSLDSAKNLKKPTAFIEKRNIKHLKLDFGSGITRFEMPSIKRGNFEFLEASPSFFWITPEENKKTLSFSQFFSGNGGSLVIRSEDEIIFALSTSLINVRDGSPKLVPRVAQIALDGEDRVLHFSPMKYFDRYKRLKCRAAKFGPEKPGRLKGSIEPGGIGGLIVRIKPVDAKITELVQFPHQISVSNFGGWANVGGVDPGELKDHDVGVLTGLSISNINNLRIDGRPEKVERDTTISVFGRVNARFDETSTFSFDGKARLAWRDQELLNVSKWDRLSTEWRMALVGWFGAMFVLFLRTVGPISRRLRSGLPLRVATVI